MILRGATCVTLDEERPVLRADLRIDPQGRIERLVRPNAPGRRGEEEILLPGRILLPGLVQTHVHLCQTLLRGLAERLPLGPWLRDRIWPLEAAHDRETLQASARLGLHELLRSGTTAVLDMGTTRHIEVLLQACDRSGIRARTGTALMDREGEVPPALRRDAGEAIEETLRLLADYPIDGDARVSPCLAPRFIPSVSERAWRAVVDVSRDHGLMIHTHACETREEIEQTERLAGAAPIPYLERLGALGPRTCLAHGVWLNERDRRLLAETGTALSHCPGSNGKLGSGTADLLRLWDAGVRVGLGCDGAACNNRLDPWEEMRRAAHAAALLHGPGAVDPARILAMATREGAEALGWGDRIGRIRPGWEADLIALDPERGPGLWFSGDDIHARIVYGAGSEHVEHVWVRGRRVVRNGRVRGLPARRVFEEATRSARLLRARVEETCRSHAS
jgi:cytosine/adenosine deaminase-related metal-dependent hydrolase